VAVARTRLREVLAAVRARMGLDLEVDVPCVAREEAPLVRSLELFTANRTGDNG